MENEEIPLKEIVKIQEALKPLGYEVYGYKKKSCTRKIILHLEAVQPFVRIDPAGGTSIIDDVDEILAIKNS